MLKPPHPTALFAQECPKEKIRESGNVPAKLLLLLLLLLFTAIGFAPGGSSPT
jgi:hypothetical protein